MEMSGNGSKHGKTVIAINQVVDISQNKSSTVSTQLINYYKIRREKIMMVTSQVKVMKSKTLNLLPTYGMLLLQL